MEENVAGLFGRLDRIAVILFNRMAEWSADGRVTAGASVYSPFIWRERCLEME